LNFLDDQYLELFPGNILERGLLLQKIRRVRQHDINRLTEHFIEILNFPSSGQCFVGDLVFANASEEFIDERKAFEAVPQNVVFVTFLTSCIIVSD
jgi:hypothetical protein